MIKNIISKAKSIKDRQRRKNAPNVLSAINTIILELNRSGQTPTPARVSQLVVLCDLWCLKLLDRPLHSSETTMVKFGGPTVMAVHNALRHYGFEPITDFVKHPAAPSIDYPHL